MQLFMEKGKLTTNSPDVRKVVGFEVVGDKHAKPC